jgi:hypothetical protein
MSRRRKWEPGTYITQLYCGHTDCNVRQVERYIIMEFRKFRESTTGKSQGPLKPEDWISPDPQS